MAVIDPRTPISYTWQVNQIDCQGNTVDTQTANTETGGNTIYALIGAGQPVKADAQLIELWKLKFNDDTGNLISRELVAYRPLVEGAVCPYVQAREYVDQEIAGIALDLAQGMAQVTDAITGASIANTQDINSVISAIQKKISSVQASNTRALNSVLANPGAQTFSVPQSAAGLNVIEPTIRAGCSGDYWITFNQVPYKTHVSTWVDAVSLAVEAINAHQFPAITQAAMDNWNNLIQNEALNLSGLNGQYGVSGVGQDEIFIQWVFSCAPSIPTPTPIVAPIAGQPIPQAPITSPIPTQIVPAQCPSCGCVINVTAPVTVVSSEVSGGGATTSGQSISPVVDWDDPFAEVAGLLTKDQIDRVEAYLDPVDPAWKYRSAGEEAAALSVPDVNVDTTLWNEPPLRLDDVIA